jgi:hypothetical protein
MDVVALGKAPMETRKPNWWQLYVLVPTMVAALLVDSRMTYSATMHQYVEIGIVVVTFALMALWIQVNRAGIETEEFDQTSISVEVPDRAEFPIGAEVAFFVPDGEAESRVSAFGPSPEMAKYN